MLFSLPLVAAAAFLGVASTSTTTTTVRINPLGDSITGSPGCWRALLYQSLLAASPALPAFDFVGTLPGQGCGVPYDGDNDGHGGYLATGIVAANQLPAWLAVSAPDVVMLQLGTNDVWSGVSTAAILDAYGTLVEQMRKQNERVLVLVAQITPLEPRQGGCETCAKRVMELNAAIPGWAKGVSTEVSEVEVVDCWSGFDTGLHTDDGVHPNEEGNVVLAGDWFAAVSSAVVRVGGGATETSAAGSTSKGVTTSKWTTTTSVDDGPVPTSSLVTKTSSSVEPTGTGFASPLYGQCGMY